MWRTLPRSIVRPRDGCNRAIPMDNVRSCPTLLESALSVQGDHNTEAVEAAPAPLLIHGMHRANQLIRPLLRMRAHRAARAPASRADGDSALRPRPRPMTLAQGLATGRGTEDRGQRTTSSPRQHETQCHRPGRRAHSCCGSPTGSRREDCPNRRREGHGSRRNSDLSGL